MPEYDTGDLSTLVIEDEDMPRLRRLEAIRDRLAVMLQPETAPAA